MVCHSNGAAVTWMATHKAGARPSGVVMMQPALDEWRMPLCEWAHVYYNADDSITWLSGLLIGNVWGPMGRIGYRPNGDEIIMDEDYAIQNVKGEKFKTEIKQIDTIRDAPAYGVKPAKGHIAIFQQPDVQAWGKIAGEKIRKELA